MDQEKNPLLTQRFSHSGRSDLAIELQEETDEKVNLKRENFGIFKKEILEEELPEDEEEHHNKTGLGMEKQQNRIATFHFPSPLYFSKAERRLFVLLIAKELQKQTENCFKNKQQKSVLVAGLGNEKMTADALGPKTAAQLTVTGYLEKENPELLSKLGTKLGVVVPGVYGETGVETSKLIAGAVHAFHPQVVLAVDALACRNVAHLGRTLQISSFGIFPGSGMGNRREPLNQSTLGVPVIALGVPTMIPAPALFKKEERGKKKGTKDHKETSERKEQFFMMDKEADVVTECLAGLLGEGISRAFLKL